MKTIVFALVGCASLFAQAGGSNVNVNGGAEAGRVVGKPYSATQVTHTVQTLANGSHIDRITSYLIYQDDQGRVRMEITGDHPQVVIRDVVGGSVYNLDPVHKTARKTTPMAGVLGKGVAGDVSPVEEARTAARRNPNITVEDLGSQSLNGVTALGVRITTTIPVGSIGNDQELKSVTERWYSNDIHAMVKTVTTDPRSGVYTYELTNIVRLAPDPLLFQVPPDYTVTEIENRRLNNQ